MKGVLTQNKHCRHCTFEIILLIRFFDRFGATRLPDIIAKEFVQFGPNTPYWREFTKTS